MFMKKLLIVRVKNQQLLLLKIKSIKLKNHKVQTKKGW